MENEVKEHGSLNDKTPIRVCNFDYLNEMMGNKKELVREIIDVFLEQVPDELETLSRAIESTDYVVIKSLSHTLKSSVSIMGINTATPILQEMEDLGSAALNIERITTLNEALKLIAKQAIEEIKQEVIKYE
jgi:HPt (histidine-containing phosphotransfer) domain-containing protein